MCGVPNTRLKLTARVESFFSAPQLRRKPLDSGTPSIRMIRTRVIPLIGLLVIVIAFIWLWTHPRLNYAAESVRCANHTREHRLGPIPPESTKCSASRRRGAMTIRFTVVSCAPPGIYERAV